MPRAPRLLSLVVLAAAPLVPLGCSATASPDGGRDEVVQTSSAALTGDNAVSRADQWVAAQLHYCQAPNGGRDYDSACSTYCHRTSNAAWDPYRSDCSGLVSWAWRLPAPGRVTGEFAPFQTDITHAIPASELGAGDAVNNSEHVMLFKSWDVPGKRATFIEEPGCSSQTPYAHELTSDVTISGSTISVAWNGMTFTAIRYDAMQPPNRPPRGVLDPASCAAIAGWAEDPDAPAAPLFVDLSFDAAPGKPGARVHRVLANVHRADLCAPLGTCDHGFSLPVPLALRDGRAHAVYALAADDSGQGPSTSLAASAPTVTCPPPAIPLAPDAAIKRWVPSPAALAAWKLDPLLDVAIEPKADADGYSKGPDLPPAPTAVIADDGAPEVWVVDGPTRRHVVDAASLSAWRLTVAKWPAAKVHAPAGGPDWPRAPFAFAGAGESAIYVLDVAPAKPSPAPGAVGTPGAGVPSGDPSAEPGGASAGAASNASGCALRAGSDGGAAAAGLFALVVVLRRRRKAS